MKHLILTLVVCLLASCNSSTICPLEHALTGGLSVGIAKALKCNNLTQIETDMESIVAKVTPGVCSMQQGVQGIGSTVCSTLATVGVAALGSQIPANWKCDPSSAEATVSTAITSVCYLIPF